MRVRSTLGSHGAGALPDPASVPDDYHQTTAHPALHGELRELRRSAPHEVRAIEQAMRALRLAGPSLGFPHTSAVRGAHGLRELRPRAGHGPWRILYRRGAHGIAFLALAPEALRDPRGFRRACERAHARSTEVT